MCCQNAEVQIRIRNIGAASTCTLIGAHHNSSQWQVGLVGYVYNQISRDSGTGDRVGCFESRVAGIGPQVGYIFPSVSNTRAI